MSSLSTANLGWIVLGIGAALVITAISGLAIGLRAVFRRRAGGRFRGVSAFVPKEAPGPLPTDIYAALQALPPLQQTKAAKAYRGMPVRWQVTFQDASTYSPGTISLICRDRGNPFYPLVMCDVRKRQYPQLQGLLQNAPLWISGRVGKIWEDQIHLQNARLEFGE